MFPAVWVAVAAALLGGLAYLYGIRSERERFRTLACRRWYCVAARCDLDDPCDTRSAHHALCGWGLWIKEDWL